MKFEDIVRSQPGQYYAESGAIQKLPELIANFQKPVIITGQKSFQAFEYHYDGPDFPVLRYDKTSSHEDMDRLAIEAQALQADLIIGIGGGKVLDTSKGVAERLSVELVTIPTVAGTCACVTPISAVYSLDHSFKAVDYYRRSGFLTLVDYDLLIQSPHDYLKGGITDTLAKWYEAESIIRQYTLEELPAMVQLGFASSKVTHQILLRDTNQALQSIQERKLSEPFKRVIDTVFSVAGYVGCQACQYGRMSGAHAIHNGLTLFHETDSIQHGVKVAYGILILLCSIDKEKEVRSLLPYYKENQFIYSWEQLGIKEEFETAALQVATYAASEKETYRLAKPDVQPQDILQAMIRLEKLVNEELD